MSMISSKNNLKELRKARGLTQQELAKISGVSLICINKYEEDRTDMLVGKFDTIMKLCVALKCTLPQMFKDKDLQVKLKKICK